MNRTRLKIQLVKHEGDRRKPYTDTAGHLTIGVGRNLEAKPLSDAVVALMLDEDIIEALGVCTRLFMGFDTFSEPRQHALIDMAFNLGEHGLGAFTKMRAAVDAREWARVAEEAADSDWFHQVGQRGRTLVQMLKGDS